MRNVIQKNLFCSTLFCVHLHHDLMKKRSVGRKNAIGQGTSMICFYHYINQTDE